MDNCRNWVVQIGGVEGRQEGSAAQICLESNLSQAKMKWIRLFIVLFKIWMQIAFQFGSSMLQTNSFRTWNTSIRHQTFHFFQFQPYLLYICLQICLIRPFGLLLTLLYKLQGLLIGETIMRWGACEYQQSLKKKAFCHQQEFDESGVFDDLKTSPPLTDLFLTLLLTSYQCTAIAGNLLTVLVILLYMGRDGDRRGERRSRSRDRDKQKKRHKKRDFSSSSQEKERRKHHRKHKQHRRSPEGQSYWKRQQPKEESANAQPIVKELPCWEPSGILLQFYNARDGVSLKFHEPPESRPPTDTWKVYVFKGDEVLQPIELSASCFLMGKDERICDILCLNPSISRQHAVIQFRLISKMNIEGDYTESIRPYVMDLGSTNGTFLNDQQIEPSRYYELLHKDVLRLGHSDRLYVLVKDQGVARHAEQD